MKYAVRVIHVCHSLTLLYDWRLAVPFFHLFLEYILDYCKPQSPCHAVALGTSSFHPALIGDLYPNVLPSATCPSLPASLFCVLSEFFLAFTCEGEQEDVTLLWLIVLNRPFSSIYFATNDRIRFFLRLNHMPLCVCAAFSLPVHLMLDNLVDSLSWLL